MWQGGNDNTIISGEITGSGGNQAVVSQTSNGNSRRSSQDGSNNNVGIMQGS